MNELVLLFLKAPVRGTVKTRLASAIGAEAALELFRCFILDTAESVTRAGLPLRICFTPASEINKVADLLPPQSYNLMPQEGKDLGERMENAFRRAFAEGCCRAVLLGSDIPDLPADIIGEALAALLSVDLVLGPARDGGYYLIGMTGPRVCQDLFRGIPWSSPSVFRLTLQKAQAAGLKVHLLPDWNDVDSVEDLRDLVSRNRDTAFKTSRTMAYLKKGGRF